MATAKPRAPTGKRPSSGSSLPPARARRSPQRDSVRSATKRKAGKGTAPRAGSRTRARLLDAGVALVARLGHVPSIGDVAQAAGVSRATAYRYFSSRSRLTAAIVDFSLGPVRQFESELSDAGSRLSELFRTTFVRFKEFEPQMRCALQLSLEHGALKAAGRLNEDQYRRGYRKEILRRTFSPLRATVPAADVERLCKALSLVFGIESYVVLKDIWGCGDEEIERISFWIATSLLSSIQSEALQRSLSADDARSLPPRGGTGQEAETRLSAAPRAG